MVLRKVHTSLALLLIVGFALLDPFLFMTWLARLAFVTLIAAMSLAWWAIRVGRQSRSMKTS